MTSDNTATQTQSRSRFAERAKTLLGILLPLLIAIIPIVLTYYFSKKQEIDLKINEEKMRRYENLITYIDRGFLDSTRDANEKTQNKQNYYEQTYIVWLYASDDVISNLNQFALAFSEWDKKKTPELESKVRSTIGRMVLAMRKDIRGKTGLTESDFITTTVQGENK